ncbi:hypothetical protein IWX47DRAFT_141825 [Phyllosticta citricarpa]
MKPPPLTRSIHALKKRPLSLQEVALPGQKSGRLARRLRRTRRRLPPMIPHVRHEAVHFSVRGGGCEALSQFQRHGRDEKIVVGTGIITGVFIEGEGDGGGGGGGGGGGERSSRRQPLRLDADRVHMPEAEVRRELVLPVGDASDPAGTGETDGEEDAVGGRVHGFHRRLAVLERLRLRVACEDGAGTGVVECVDWEVAEPFLDAFARHGVVDLRDGLERAV